MYKYPVGLLGLQISIALVFGVIRDSNFSIEGNAKPSSIEEGKVLITAPAVSGTKISSPVSSQAMN